MEYKINQASQGLCQTAGWENMSSSRDSHLDVKEWFLCHKWFYENTRSCHQFTFTHKYTQATASALALAQTHTERLFLLGHTFLSFLFFSLTHRPRNGLTSPSAQRHQSRHICCPPGQTDRICNYLSGILWLLHWTFTQESRPSYVMASLAQKRVENAN